MHIPVRETTPGKRESTAAAPNQSGPRKEKEPKEKWKTRMQSEDKEFVIRRQNFIAAWNEFIRKLHDYSWYFTDYRLIYKHIHI